MKKLENSTRYLLVASFFLISISIYILTIVSSKGEVYFFYNYKILVIYTIFYISFTAYLFLSFFYFYSFTHLVLSVFLWLGFAFKYSVNNILNNTDIIIHSSFLRLKNNDEISIQLISIIGLFGVLVSFFFSKLLDNKKSVKNKKYQISEKFFDTRNVYLLVFLICIVSSLNMYFGFYQRGVYSESRLSIFFSFFFQLYLPATIYFFFYRYSIQSKPLTGFILLNFCILIYSISILSRAYVIINLFNILIFLLIFVIPKKIKFNFKIVFIILIFTLIFSATNIFSVTKLRNLAFFNQDIEEALLEFKGDQEYLEAKNKKDRKKIREKLTQNIKNDFLKKKSNYMSDRPKIFFIIEIISNRFVGIEELALVHQIKGRNFELFKKSFDTRSNRNSFFDKLLYQNKLGHSYIQDNKENKKLVGINTPGFFAFLYLSNSLVLIFIIPFLTSFLINYLETKTKFFFHNPFFIFSIFYFLINKIVHFGHNPLGIYKSFIGIAVLLCLFYMKKIIFMNSYTKSSH